eukprot:403349166
MQEISAPSLLQQASIKPLGNRNLIPLKGTGLNQLPDIKSLKIEVNNGFSRNRNQTQFGNSSLNAAFKTSHNDNKISSTLDQSVYSGERLNKEPQSHQKVLQIGPNSVKSYNNLFPQTIKNNNFIGSQEINKTFDGTLSNHSRSFIMERNNQNNQTPQSNAIKNLQLRAMTGQQTKRSSNLTTLSQNNRQNKLDINIENLQIQNQPLISSFRKQQNWGVEGYNIRKFDPYLDKVHCLQIKDTKNMTYIDMAVKAKEYLPSPQKYETSGSLIDNKRHGFGKSERITLPTEIEKTSRRELKPGPGTYDNKQNERILGAFNLKGIKSSSFIDEAQFLSSQSPTSYECKFDSVYERSPIVRMIAPKTKIGDNSKIIKNNDPSPVTYEVEKSYKSTQLNQNKFVISKSKILKFADQFAKDKKFVPGAGTYNPEKSFDKITLGASKGWK